MEDNKKSILLVEDESIIALTEKVQLEKYGYSVHIVKNGEEAVKAIVEANYHIDLVLMDFDLGGGIDGAQTAKTILEHKDIPIIFLSAHSEPEVVEKTEKITSYGYVVKNTGIVVLDASIKMAMKLFDEKMKSRRSEEALRESEERLRLITDSLPDGYVYQYTYQADGRPKFLFLSKGVVDMHGVTPEEAIDDNTVLHGQIDQDQIPALYEAEAESLGKMKDFAMDLRYHNSSGELRWFHAHSRPHRNANGQVILTGSATDITGRKQVEEMLREKEEIFSKSFMHAPLLMTISDVGDGKYIEVNDAFERISGFTREEAVGRTSIELGWLHPDDRARLIETLRSEGRVAHMEIVLHAKDGSSVICSYHGELIMMGGKQRLLSIAQDITERKRAEEEIKRQLDEKETLLKEVHHRVKNNIANIESLLSMQIMSHESAEVKSSLQDALSRVQSMRVLYDKLLLGKDYQEVPMKQYIENLVASIREVFPGPENITVETAVSDFFLAARQAVSVGIIVNELLTNILKYAFKDRESGCVTVSLEKDGPRVALTVHDNGIGIDEQIMLKESPGFGITIIKMLAEQLNGSFSIKNDNGTRSVVRFEI